MTFIRAYACPLAIALFSWFVHGDARAEGLSLAHVLDIERITPSENRYLVHLDGPGGTVAAEAFPAAVVATHTPTTLANAQSLGASGRYWRVPLPPETPFTAFLRTLASRPDVKHVFPDLVSTRQTLSMGIDDPEYPAQWYLAELQAERLWERSFGDSSVKVAVIDSGIDVAHPDLASKIIAPKDTWDNDEDPSPNPGEFCFGGGGAVCDEHGTAVAGIVLADANDINIIGVCPDCSLIPIKMLGDGYLVSPQGSLSGDVAAFEHAIEYDAAVINNSWGFNESIPVPEVLASIVRIAATQNRNGKGAVVVFAAGNEDREITNDELSAMTEVLSVTATDRYGNPTPYTNKGASVDLAAPAATLSLAPGGGITENFGGTSAAAPVVSGVAAWALSVRPELTAEEVRDLLKRTARKDPRYVYDDNGHNDLVGSGLLDLTALVHELYPPEEEDSPPAEEIEAASWGCQSSASTQPWLFLLLAGFFARRKARSAAKKSGPD